MMQIDRVIHEPVRLKIMVVLSGVEWADFPSLCRMLNLTRGNLSVHTSRLERRKYLHIRKRIIGKVPHTQYRLTQAGRKALAHYWGVMDAIRQLGEANIDA